MHFHTLAQSLGAIYFGLGAVLGSPMPWSESVPDEINQLRASGLSEKAIAAQYPRALFHPDRAGPSYATSVFTLYSPPDLRKAPAPTRHVSTTSASSAMNRAAAAAAASSGRTRNLLLTLASKLGLVCDDDDAEGQDAESLLEELIGDEGRTRFRESVGKRGQEMGRKEDHA